ncbi:cysteine desulfurase family protein [Virgibacillus litoralis]|uniref:Cysteine desulfurase n=1 Tax=Virgibacillus litoralis TaxID=578221 RepID=A0ABS4HA89_9BACI|nr:cysteine desulfurase family protein [Virgibacillus litoralis]MBP1947813.1 cysteine desulfurase [Virgibacillus litoralis]
MIYLDNSATTKPDPSVLNSFYQATERFFANPSSIHQLGGEAEKLLIKSKEQASQLLNVQQDEVIFTSGGTEGNNLAIKGIAFKHQGRGKHIITTEIEHPSVYEACNSLENLGFTLTYLPVDKNGVISIEDLTNSIRNDTILVSMMHVNNELGSIQPIKKIGEILKQYPKVFFHVDNVQGMGKVPLELKNSGIDLCTISGHKLHGLKGTGILYVNKKTTMYPLLHGGSQERSLRSGTENLAGAVSIVKALRLIKEREKTEVKDMYQLQKFLRNKLAEMEGVVINTPKEAAPHIMNISVPGLKPEVIIHMLGEKQIYISTKSACSSKQADESKILAACGYDTDRSTSALRISMSYDTTKSEIDTFLKALEEAVNQLKAVME